jgi:hypothetical protein
MNNITSTFRIAKIFFSTALGIGLPIYIGNVQSLVLSAKHLHAETNALSIDERAGSLLGEEVLKKALRYERMLSQEHLHKGMVVNRGPKGAIIDECDSLLFSCLRYAALNQLGYQHKAQESWEAIEKSQYRGKWYRHPDCPRPTSRDMLIGLMVCLSQNPPRKTEHLRQLFNVITEKKGYFGDGPFYLSYLSPGLGDILRRMAGDAGFPFKQMPASVRRGYSTQELDSLSQKDGYVSHLVALTSWLEMEMDLQQSRFKTRSLVHDINLLTNFLVPTNPNHLRQQWITHKLIDLDEKNLFFQYLFHRSHNSLSPQMRLHLVSHLLSLPQFPNTHLPNECNRHADYLWQRHSREYTPRPGSTCYKTFAGVDFLWMTALLVKEN